MQSDDVWYRYLGWQVRTLLEREGFDLGPTASEPGVSPRQVPKPPERGWIARWVGRHRA